MNQKNISVRKQVEVEIAQLALRSSFAEKYNELGNIKKQLQELEGHIGADQLAKREQLKEQMAIVLKKGKEAEEIARGIKVKVVRGITTKIKIREGTKSAAEVISLKCIDEYQRLNDKLISLQAKIDPSLLKGREELQQKISDMEEELREFEGQSKILCQNIGPSGERSCVL